MSDFCTDVTEVKKEEYSKALLHYRSIQPYLEGDCSQVELAKRSGIPIKTLQRWVARYRQHRLCGLVRLPRLDRGAHKDIPEEELLFIEGLALQKPKRSKATIHRELREVANKRGWPLPSYRRVCQIISALPAGLLSRAQEERAVHHHFCSPGWIAVTGARRACCASRAL